MLGHKAPAATRSAIEAWLVRQLAAHRGVAPEEIDTRTPVANYGLQSVDMVGLVGELETMVGRELSATLLWEYPTIDALAAFLGADPTSADPTGGERVGEEPEPTDARTGSAGEPVAVIGIGCRFPGGADDPQSYWRMLCDGRDAVTEVPASRWNIEDFVDEDPAVPGKTNTRWGGFLDGVDRFDAQFFGISPREAERMDPQHRVLAEVAWEAIEDAGLTAPDLAGSSTGVFVGIATSDYAMLQPDDFTRIDAHYGTGNASSIAANRLSYLFDLRGPSIAVDTACSSSLVALHQALQSLATGDCSIALAGGVNLILSPALAINFTKAGAMAPDGRCKAFDARANGYVRSEGAGVVVLKPLRQALADRDRIYGVIMGGAVNQDGRTNGLMAPNPHAQEAVLRAAYAKAGVTPTQVQYVEAHGTGTLLGDPIEVKALAAVVGRDRDPATPCLIGSVKSNIGHLEAAAGMAGLIKTLLMLRHRMIPPTIHYQQPNPHIPFAELAVRVADRLQPWPATAGPTLAGVSSFGFGGTNAHFVIGAPPEPASQPCSPSSPAQLLTISAQSPAALRELLARYDQQLSQPGSALTPAALAATAALRRTHHRYRLSCVGSSLPEFHDALTAFTRDEERPGLCADSGTTARQPKVAFVFAGQGPRWWPLGADLLDAHPVVSDVLERCDELLRSQVEWSLLEQLRAGLDGRLAEPAVAQPALCAVQVAVAQLWRSWGIEPSVVVGHSVGEIAAAHVAGALELSDALRAAVQRGRLIGEAADGGGMAVVGLSLEQTQQLLDRRKPSSVWIAASNAPASTVLSGDAAALDRIVATLTADGIFCRRLESVTFASHSPAMQPLSEELAHALTGLHTRPGAIPILSTVTGELVDGEALGPAYWAANLRQAVLFDPAITALAEADHNVFVEISPHPMLGEAIEERLELQAAPGVTVSSLRREEPVRAAMLGGLGRLYTAGFPVDWRRVYGPAAAMVALPSYPWQRDRHWLDDAVVRTRRTNHGDHPLLGFHLASAAPPKAHHFSARVDLNALPYLRDHRVRGTAVLPATALLDAALVAARQVFGEGAVELHDVTFTRLAPLDEDADVDTLQLVVTPEAGTSGSFTLFGRGGAAGAERTGKERTGGDRTAGEWTAGEWTALAHGGLRAADAREQPATAIAELAQARALCSEPMDVQGQYQRLREVGLEYGEAFQAIHQLWRAPGRSVAHIRPPDAIAADRHPYALHPAVLDSCLQALGAALTGASLNGGPARPQRTYLPVAVGRFRLASWPARPAWACATTTDAQSADQHPTISGRVALFDEDGGWVGEVDGLVLRSVDRTDAAAGVADSLFQHRWCELSDQPGSGVASIEAGPGWWLLFADEGPHDGGPHDGGVAERLARELAAKGDTPITVRAGTCFQRVDDHTYQVDPTRRDDFVALLAHLRENVAERCRGIVHAWNLDVELAEDDLPPALERVQDRGCGSVLYLVQALADGGLGGTPRLAVLTRGAQRVAEDTHVPSVAQGAVWGLARVVAVEHDDLRPLLVDLDPRQPADEATSLLAELLVVRRDNQLCLRAGRRYAATLEPWSAPTVDDDAARPFQERDENFQVVVTRPGILASLRPRVCRRGAPGPREVEIAVSAAGLNFSDVLKAMDLYPGAGAGVAPLGAECAGIVSAVGTEVEGYRVGDRVMAIARGSFAAFATTAEHLVSHTPDAFSDEEAAASPIAFMTAIHGLEHLARLQAGESVLIHSATGGVGLAALQLARRLGARIFATAGTEQKRELLRTLGVAHVMDSRSTRFGDQVLAATEGRGVDVVLNSLAGEALTRSVSVLAEGGRFVELGKQDVYANSHLGLKRLTHNRSFFAVDLEHCVARQPDHASYLLRRLAQGIADGEFTPLPVTAFDLAEAEAAFSLMARAQHTGKVVLRRTGTETVTAAPHQAAVRGDGSYLITGGLGALGLASAHYLVDQGARHLLLMGRSAPSAAAESTLAQLRSKAATVTIFRGDVTDNSDVDSMMALIDRELPPLRGVIHAAGSLDDGLLVHLDRQRLRSVLAPKLAGSWNMHLATMKRDLDFFVLYSSAAALLGSPGQGNYAAANAFLDSLAAYRRARGLPAQAIDWGPWSEIGLAAQPDRAGHLAERGIGGISTQHGIAALHTLLPTASPQVAVLCLDRTKLQAAAAGGLLPRIFSALVDDVARAATSASASAFAGAAAEIRARLLAVEPGRRRRDILTQHLRHTMAQVLKLDPARVDADEPLASLGFDSLMSLELRKRLETTLGVTLPATLAWRYPTVEALVPFLAELMGISVVSEARTAIEEPAAGAGDDTLDAGDDILDAGVDTLDAGDGTLDAGVDTLEHATDAEIEAMLLAKLQAIDNRL